MYDLIIKSTQKYLYTCTLLGLFLLSIPQSIQAMESPSSDNFSITFVDETTGKDLLKVTDACYRYNIATYEDKLEKALSATGKSYKNSTFHYNNNRQLYTNMGFNWLFEDKPTAVTIQVRAKIPSTSSSNNLLRPNSRRNLYGDNFTPTSYPTGQPTYEPNHDDNNSLHQSRYDDISEFPSRYSSTGEQFIEEEEKLPSLSWQGKTKSKKIRRGVAGTLITSFLALIIYKSVLWYKARRAKAQKQTAVEPDNKLIITKLIELLKDSTISDEEREEIKAVLLKPYDNNTKIKNALLSAAEQEAGLVD